MDTLIGFDSAWTNNARAPGAICAIQRHATGDSTFYPPKLTSFEGALQFISETESDAGITLIALDQPTIVSISQGKRPVESAASPLMGWIGGAVQPSNRNRLGMFCDASPIWTFLSQLQALEEPEKARAANEGRYLIEVFPALAMPSLDETFFGRLKAPKYNPERKTFKIADWRKVCEVLSQLFADSSQKEASLWCANAAESDCPCKALQDKLDAMVCLYIALHWRFHERSASMILGSRDSGYMVLPAVPNVRSRLASDAAARSVPVDLW